MALAIIRNDSAIRLSNKNISQTHKNKKNTVILYALFTKDMSSEPLKIDIEKVVKEKAPKYAKKIPGFLFRYLERTIHQDEINYILKTYKDSTGVKFADDLLSYMNVHINVIGKENIPPEGRFIFASNHPLGALDGVALIRFFGHFYSGKIKFLVNDLLMHIKPLAPVFLPINKYGSQAKESSLQINNAYESDEQMLIFPAGLCSRLQHGKIKDLEWKKTFIAKAVQSQRDIIPIYFEGRNSTFFYRFAQIRKCIGLKFNIELIYLNDKLVGFYNGKNKDDNTFEIANICIMPEYQNNGIGTAVLKEILFENNDKDVFLQCFKESPAMKLFERIEFGKIMETEQHYIMKKIKK